MPVEFRLEPTRSSSDTLFRLLMKYDGTGRRISKTVMRKVAGAADWDTAQVTHYTGIGTEVRENLVNNETKVVVNMPVFFRVTLTRLKPRSYIEKDILRLSNGGAILPKRSFGASRQSLGRYKVADASQPADDNASRTFEWYLKNHLGSTMLVYGTVASTDPNNADVGETKAAYDYRAFGEMVTLSQPSDKVTENFTGSRFTRRMQRTACKSIAEPKNLGAKRNEHDDEIALNYFGARYLDPMLGMWISVDPARQFASPYLYAGNGVNPVNGVDGDGNVLLFAPGSSPEFKAEFARAIKYLNNGKSSAIIANLHKRKEVVYVREVSEAAGGEDGFNARALESDIEYDDQEKMRVIQGSETSAAKKLDEGVRHGHGGNSKIVDHSDER